MINQKEKNNFKPNFRKRYTSMNNVNNYNYSWKKKYQINNPKIEKRRKSVQVTRKKKFFKMFSLEDLEKIKSMLNNNNNEYNNYITASHTDNSINELENNIKNVLKNMRIEIEKQNNENELENNDTNIIVEKPKKTFLKSKSQFIFKSIKKNIKNRKKSNLSDYFNEKKNDGL